MEHPPSGDLPLGPSMLGSSPGPDGLPTAGRSPGRLSLESLSRLDMAPRLPLRAASSGSRRAGQRGRWRQFTALGSFCLGLVVSAPAWAQPEPEAPPSADDDAPLLGEAPEEPEEPEEPREPEAKRPPPPRPEPPEPTEADDEAAEAAGAKKRPTAIDLSVPTSEVYAEDWWNLSRPTFEIHGYYRVRTEFRSHFALGRVDGEKPLWPQPPDKSFTDTQGNKHELAICGDDPDNLEPCDNNTQAGANMRFRLNPELHISDNIRVRAQIDMLDNVVLGSTPEGYANAPGPNGYQVVPRGGYSPLGAFASTQWAPTSGVNSPQDSIVVKRVWGEYSTPIGQLRFGRMPSHWGLGMFVNSGDGYDSDWQTTADRLMFITGIRSWDLYFAAAWDFANEGPTSAVLNEQQGTLYDLSQKDDVDQWVFVIVRRMEEAAAKAQLREGSPVFEGGAYFVYRQQQIANDTTDPGRDASLGATRDELAEGYTRRGAQAFIPDAWLKFRWHSFRFEAEAALIWGSIENTLPSGPQSNYNNPADPNNPGWDIRQFGIATESEFLALDDKLRIGLKFGYATGDDDVESLAPIGNELQPQLTLDRTYSTFRFHPDYRVDLIFWRHIMTRVQGAYYFRPSVGYDFIKDPDGQKIGGDAAVVWSRASQFVQTPGHAHDLGVELNFKLHYQAKDGVLNDDPDKMGGFYTSLEYAVFFPLDGLDYLPVEVQDYAGKGPPLETDTAQMVRWYLGILF
jgi:uncharacterized protein (TIGR04551 family)